MRTAFDTGSPDMPRVFSTSGLTRSNTISGGTRESEQLMRAVRYLVAGDEALSQTQVAHDSALNAGQNVPASLFTAQRVTTAEITSPSSVTEQTTNLLESK